VEMPKRIISQTRALSEHADYKESQYSAARSRMRDGTAN
jgi:hypothetical protein